MQFMTLSEIRRAAQNGPVTGRVHVQVELATPRVWSDHPADNACSAINRESFVELAGDFISSQYALDAQKWNVRPLTEQEKNELLQGPAELRAKQAEDWKIILETISKITDPRLRALCGAFVKEFSDRFRRTAAARRNHHARRGGLVEHTAQMMRTAMAIVPLYPQLNVDLLIAGILFHDSGKLWENHYSETGFVMDYDERGELIGHISIGLALVNSFCRKSAADNGDAWKNLTPPSEDVRLHLLHLIGAHHGEQQFGSPVDPKTPEAMALHYIDNLDARLEMFAAGYLTAKPLADRIFQRVWPLPSKLVKSLGHFSPPTSPGKKEGELL